jgi:hypothetical protein
MANSLAAPTPPLLGAIEQGSVSSMMGPSYRLPIPASGTHGQPACGIRPWHR